jgi:SOS-response transcriptional repressor LexA
MIKAKKKQKKERILSFIKKYKDKNEISPSLREIKEKLDISISCIHKYLHLLEKEKYIKIYKRKARGIKILK